MEPTPGQLVRAARRRHRLTQRELARRCGTTQSAISRVERDRLSPSVETLAQLLAVMGEELTIGAESDGNRSDLPLPSSSAGGRLLETPSL